MKVFLFEFVREERRKVIGSVSANSIEEAREKINRDEVDELEEQDLIGARIERGSLSIKEDVFGEAD